jgi:cohesin complex subunit SCC1
LNTHHFDTSTPTSHHATANMFYSELLLTKTGPLARVWLASNLDRKLTKQNVLQSNLEDNVKNIIGGEQAPIALRLSGQLLLGVVKIYNRKAKYLMDDCSEALLKIKMAFRPGNVDLPTDQSHKANPTALMMPDTITELDLFAPLPDPEDILREPENRAPGQDPTLLDFGMSQILDSQTPTRANQKRTLQQDDDDLGLDLGLDGDDLIRSTPMSDGPSIELGRRAPTPRRDEPTMLEEDDLGLDFGFGADTTLGGGSIMPTREFNDEPLNLDDDFQMGGMEGNDEIAKGNAAALERADLRRQRDSDSPLSSVRSSVERDLEKTFQLDQAGLDETDPTIVQAAQRVKRRKVVRMDAQTELGSTVLKSQQADTSAITKAPSYLPRDPLLLQLMEMQRNGSFVSNLMGDGRMQGWAPELRGIFSLEVVRKAGDKKRKRDSGIVADISPAGSRQQTPQLEIPQDDDEGFQAGAGGAANDFPDITLNDDDAPLPMSDRGEDDEEAEEMDQNFDITEAPLLHPSQSGAIALGTQKMVQRLRQYFAPDHPKGLTEPPTPSKRVAASALFTDLCPTESTSRQEATNNFFELLQLGTKDAVKVEQQNSELGLPIRVRGKRGLWGEWAAMGTTSESQEAAAGGELQVGA